MRSATFLLAVLVLGCLSQPTARAANAPGPTPDAPEVTVCGPLRERLAFWSWSRAAGRPQPARAEAVRGAEPVRHLTRDGRRLAGWRLARGNDAATPRRTVLVAGGNAMLADQILPAFEVFADAGLEVYVFDYRGYGASEGKPRLLAIIGDHLELAHRLATEGGGPLAFYGISFGGIVLANVAAQLGPERQPERFVIDGTPARVSTYGCPDTFDPVSRLPEDTSHVLFVGGGRDTVVPLGQSAPLIEMIRAGGGRVEVHPDRRHPFMDSDPELHRERLALIRDFLAGDEQLP